MESANAELIKNSTKIVHDNYMRLLISGYHKVVYHNGIKETLNELRQTYWIIRGRKAVIRRCVLCLKFEGKPYSSEVQPDLPGERVSNGPPLMHTRIDFAGPLYVQSNGQQQKVYLCWYTRASTRAVHPEITKDLTALSLLQSFR